jgi:serine/threonine protein kinase
MSLQPGTQLGRYEIRTAAGAGGMGEVYKARDTRLDRDVAIKVLPAHLSESSALRQRFEREARAASSLNHPNICSLYDIGHEQGVDFLVMEYLDGETMSARLEKGPLQVDDLLRHAEAIADALDKAHRQGLIHRDLKPGNIMLTKSGAKLLDFGLAKSTTGSPASEMTAAVTATSPLTAEGTIVGTYQYMSPEQLEGSEADARSDIFAFGILLYEMATGRRAFEGKTQASLVASILKEQPRSLASVAPMTPPALDRLIRTCLEKDPDDRRQTMHDVLLELRWIREAGSQAGVPAPVSRNRKIRERALWLLATASLAVAVTFAVLWRQAATRPEHVITSSILAPHEVIIRAGQGLVLSPDGSHLAFIGKGADGVDSLWVRPLDSAEARRLPETTNAFYPFWSPDSKHIGFLASGQLKRIDSRGGPTQVLTAAPEGRGGTWNADGTIVFSPSFRGGLQRISATGGTSEEISDLDAERGETSHRFPRFLPDGKNIIFLSQTHEGGTPDDRSRFELLNLETGDRKVLFAANSSAQFSPTGHILFWSQGAVYAQPFDAGRLEVTGDLFPVAEKVQYTVNEYAAFSASDEGTLVFQRGEGLTGVSTLVWFDRAGKRGDEITKPGIVLGPRLSGDERQLAYELQGDIWVHDLVRGTDTRLSFGTNYESVPVWAPDGRSILYSAQEGAGGALYRKLASGLGDAERLYENLNLPLFATDWSSDGASLLINILDPEGSWNLSAYTFEDETMTPLLQTPFLETWGRFSPDGEWFAYSSDESGTLEVYVVRLSGPGGRWQISTKGGWAPAWKRDSSEIFFVAPGGTLMAVTVELGEAFKAGIPEMLFQVNLRPGTNWPFEPTADGQRFVVNTLPQSTALVPPTLVQNWTTSVDR